MRDLLLGKLPKDYDIGTDARPRDIKRLFRNSRIIGRRFELVHVYFPDHKIMEVSTFRDSASPESLAEIDSNELMLAQDNTYGTPATDALRRDLTINALFYDISNFSVIDYVGGMQDLRNGIIRIIGNPDVRIIEDPVRMMRALRHAARNNFRIDPETYISIENNRALIRKCPGVRIYDELKKDLLSGHVAETLLLFNQSHLIEFIMPDLISNLTHRDTDFLQCIRSADSLIKQGQSLSTTLFLSIFALFSGNVEYRLGDLVARFKNKAAAREHSHDSLRDLSVPRRERDAMSQLIAQWFTCKTTPAQRLRIGSLRRFLLLPELADLLHITACSREDLAVLKVVDGCLGV